MVYGAILEGDNNEGYTYLLGIFKSMNHFQKNYNWLITDCEICARKIEHRERFFQSGDHAWISGMELTGIIKKENFQWIWGVLSGFQNPLADIEIVAWDSSATLFLTKDIGLYRIFRKAFPKSKDLKLFNTTDFDEANDYEKWLKNHV